MGVLDGKVALVTGGSCGIGRAIVQRLARDGAAVVFSFKSNQAAAGEVTAAVTRDGGRAVAVQVDRATRPRQRPCSPPPSSTTAGWTSLVNNAATYPQATIADTTEHDYDQVMALNTKGVECGCDRRPWKVGFAST